MRDAAQTIGVVVIVVASAISIDASIDKNMKALNETIQNENNERAVDAIKEAEEAEALARLNADLREVCAWARARDYSGDAC